MLQKPETARAAREPGNAAPGIGNVAEDQCISRAGLGAGWLHLSVPDQPPFGLCLFLCPADPLNTEGALFHHAAGAYGDVRRELVIERRRPGMLVIVEVEDPHGIGAVIAAVAGADAAVVNLAVQAVRVVALARAASVPKL